MTIVRKIIDKNDVGLGNVDNTSDANKPISAAVAAALAGKAAIDHVHAPGSGGTTTQLIAPQNTTLPSLSSGTAKVGVPLTVNIGVWTGSPAPVIKFQWKWADTGAPINGATNLSYTPVAADVGHPLVCVLTGDNGVGTPATASTPATAPVAAINTSVAPSVVTSPSISPLNPVVGSVLTFDPGVWGGSPAPVISRQWIYADTGAAIPNATGLTYQVAPADQGHTIAVTGQGSNNVGNPVPYTTAPTAIVPGSAPVATAQPQLNPGFGAVGDTLAMIPATWNSSDPITRSYKWFRADTNELLATTATYVLQPADAGHYIRAEEVATNRWGASNPALTAWSGQITGTTTGGGGTGSTPTSPPSLVASPSISGSLVVGGSITGTPGTYNG